MNPIEVEKDFIQEQIEADKKYGQELGDLFDENLDDLILFLGATLIPFIFDGTLSIAKAKTRVTKTKRKRYGLRSNSSKLDAVFAGAGEIIDKLGNEQTFKLEKTLAIDAKAELERLKKTQNVGKVIDKLGTTYSDYIWNDTEKLKNLVNNSIRHALIRGESLEETMEKLTQEVTKLYKGTAGKGGAKFAAERVAMTTRAEVLSICKVEVARAEGEKWVTWVSENDARVCDVCSKRHGKHYTLEDFEKIKPPVHPMCRCSAILGKH